MNHIPPVCFIPSSSSHSSSYPASGQIQPPSPSWSPKHLLLHSFWNTESNLWFFFRQSKLIICYLFACLMSCFNSIWVLGLCILIAATQRTGGELQSRTQKARSSWRISWKNPPARSGQWNYHTNQLFMAEGRRHCRSYRPPNTVSVLMKKVIKQKNKTAGDFGLSQWLSWCFREVDVFIHRVPANLVCMCVCVCGYIHPPLSLQSRRWNVPLKSLLEHIKFNFVSPWRWMTQSYFTRLN